MKRNLRHEGFGGARAAVPHLETSECAEGENMEAREPREKTEVNGSKSK
jgi:hypothetical protein